MTMEQCAAFSGGLSHKISATKKALAGVKEAMAVIQATYDEIVAGKA